MSKCMLALEISSLSSELAAAELEDSMTFPDGESKASCCRARFVRILAADGLVDDSSRCMVSASCSRYEAVLQGSVD